MHKIKLVAGIASLVLLVCVGCGRSDLPELGYVEGTVTMDGAALPGALVMFQPKSGRPSYGRTDGNGWYELIYTEGNKGATVGTHRVSISTREDGDEDTGVKPVPEKVPAQYNVNTDLTREVKAGDNEFGFELTSKGEIIDQREEGPED